MCEQCGVRQPGDWKAGERCIACGGAVRAEQRCAGCSRWTPRAKFCRHCGAELLPPELYGAARMLLGAGVDRFSLAGRTLALDPGQRDTLGAQYATQAARAAWLVEEVRFCERFLLQHGYWERLDDELTSMLPASSPDAIGRLPPAAGLDLEELFEHSTLHGTRVLAALALLRTGKVRRPVLELARYTVECGDPRLELEAVLALSSWRSWTEEWPEWRLLRRRSEVASKALGEATLRPWAAIAVALPLWRGQSAFEQDYRARLEALGDPLREALTAPDPRLRFDAALALGDVPGLEAALDAAPASGDAGTSDQDAERRALARRRLAELHAPRVVRELRDVEEEGLRDVLRGLSVPFPLPIADALLERALRSDARFRRDALAKLREERFWELPLESRIALGQAIAREADRLRAPELMEFLTWATTPETQEYGVPVELVPEGAGPIQAAATAALGRAPVEERKAILRDADFDRWVSTSPPEDGRSLDGWTGDPEVAVELFEQLLSAHARLNSWDKPLRPRAMDLLVGLWDRSDRKAELAPSLNKALGHNRGITHREDINAAFWRRFRERPEERGVLMVAAESWRQDLYELRDKEAPEISLDGGDPVAFFRLYASVDPNARAVLHDALEKRRGEERLLELVDAVFDLADAQVARRPFDMMLVVAPLCSAVANAYRSDERTDRHAAAAVRLQERWATFSRALEAMKYGPDSEPSPRHLFEQAEVELRLIAEEQERSRPPPPKPRPVPPTKERGAAPTASEQVAVTVASAPAPTPVAVTAVSDPALAPVAAPVVSAPTPYPVPVSVAAQATRVRLIPAIELLPIDREALAAPPISTLLDYVELMKQMSGGNPLEVFAQAGLDIAAWTRTCNEWGTVMMRRPDAAMRFATLLQAVWAPR